jgi:hypothetical protein
MAPESRTTKRPGALIAPVPEYIAAASLEFEQFRLSDLLDAN